MNKLVSKNPVLRFKEGKKIIKAEEGAVARWQRRIKHPILSFKNLDARTPIPDPFRYLDNKIGKAINWMNNTFVVKDGYTPENGGTTNNRLRNQQLNTAKQNTYKTPELKSSKEAYLNRLKLLGFTAKPTKPIVKTTPVVKKQSVVPRSGWSYGYDRSNEISDIKAVQDMLRNGGFYAKGANSRSDGAWGKDTELAYLNYLKSKLQQLAPELPSTTDLVLHITSLINFNQPNKSSAPFIYDLLLATKEQAEKSSNNQYIPQEIPELFLAMLMGKRYYKQGGQLISRNPVLRFKEDNIIKAQKGLKTAPKAKERYNEGRKYSTPNENGDHVDVVIGLKPGTFTHAPIFTRIISPTGLDTTYVETPEHTSFVDVKPRVIQNNWYEDENGNIIYNNSPEFYTMKRRFNEALLSANKGKLTPLQSQSLRPITYKIEK